MSGDSLRRSFLQSLTAHCKTTKRRKNESGGNEYSLLRVLCALKVELILPARSFVSRRLLHILLLFCYLLLICMASKYTRAVDDKQFGFQLVNRA